eukprot:scaffold2.g7474.t1
MALHEGLTLIKHSLDAEYYEALSKEPAILYDGRRTVKNRRRWTPLDEAVGLHDAALTKLLYTRLKTDAKAEKKRKKVHLVAIMEGLADFKMKLRWELGSPLFGLLLRRYAPDDTYQIWKAGTRLRMDGSLMGLDDKSRSLIPQWKRGSFSLLVDVGTTPTTSYFVNHTERTYADLYRERKAGQKGIDSEVEEMLAEGSGKVKMATSEMEFRQARTWLGRPVTEKLEGWQTQVHIPEGTTFEAYLTMQLPEDHIEAIPLDPLHPPPSAARPPASPPASPRAVAGAAPASPSAASSPAHSRAGSGSGGGRGGAVARKARKVSGKVWMAQEFPMSLRELLPLLEVVAAGNKHFASAAEFLERFGDQSLFPVPIIFTVYLSVAFSQFMLLGPADAARQPAFFELPAGYRRVSSEQATGSEGPGLIERLDSGQLQLPPLA